MCYRRKEDNSADWSAALLARQICQTLRQMKGEGTVHETVGGVLFGFVYFDTTRLGTARYGLARHGTARYGTVRYGTCTCAMNTPSEG